MLERIPINLKQAKAESERLENCLEYRFRSLASWWRLPNASRYGSLALGLPHTYSSAVILLEQFRRYYHRHIHLSKRTRKLFFKWVMTVEGMFTNRKCVVL